MSAQPTFTLCPPHAAAGILQDEPNFNHKQKPVHLPDRDEEGDGYARGISFEDYSRMQTSTRTTGRKQPTPLWSQSDAAVRHVLLAFLETRAFSKKKCAGLVGNERQRFIAVIQRLKDRSASLIATLECLCSQFVATTDPARRKMLTTEISGLDRQIQLVSRPDIFHTLIVARYRERLDSVGVAERCGLSPWGVRQLCFRLNKVARSLGYEIPSPLRGRPPQYPSEQARKQAAAERKAARLAVLEAKRNARLLEKASRDAKHLERQQRAFAEREASSPNARRARGECPHCGKKPPEGYKTCEKVRAEHRDWIAARKQRAGSPPST